MINKQEILDKYKDKESKLLASVILDKIIQYEKRNCIVNTNFLNLNEYNIAISLLNKFKVNYEVFSLNDMLERRCVALIPNYTLDNNFDFLSCIKVVSNNKLLHKDYMGSIYNIGINEDMIGDIILSDNCAYIFLMNKVLDYIELNFDQVGKEKIKIEVVDINDLKDLTYNFLEKNITVSSNRIDAILSKIYNLSRTDVMKKISKGELYINSVCIKKNVYNLKEGDIVSFKRCGKFKYLGIIKTTKKDKIVLNIQIYN